MPTPLQYIRNIDATLLRIFNPQRQTAWVLFFQALSDTTSIIAYGAPVLLFLIALIRRSREGCYRSLAVFLTVLIADYAALPIKIFVNRHRPYDVYDTIIRYSDGGNASFPSGHTTQAMAMAFSVALIYRKRAFSIPVIIWAILVGFGRAYLGVHFPSDVIGATLLAGIVAILVWLVWRRMSKARPSRSTR